ncbi:MAG TPA: hypothetical protein VJQ61_10785 [Sinomonas sp.]|nr:hypothetical protein [Sinomonas sp.]
MRRSTKLATAVAIAGLAFAGVSAFTANNTFDSGSTVPKTGYGSTTVTGATVKSLAYNLDATGANVTSATLVLDGDTSASNVSLSYNGGSSFACGTGTVSTGTVTTTYTCTTPSGSPQTTSGLTSTAVIVN